MLALFFVLKLSFPFHLFYFVPKIDINGLGDIGRTSALMNQ